MAFTHGLHGGLEIAALIALAGSLVAVTTVRKPVSSDAAHAKVLVEA